jgi:hypothetical protein
MGYGTSRVTGTTTVLFQMRSDAARRQLHATCEDTATARAGYSVRAICSCCIAPIEADASLQAPCRKCHPGADAHGAMPLDTTPLRSLDRRLYTG